MDNMLHRWGGTLLTAGGALLAGTGLFLAPRWLALLLVGLICLALGWLWLTQQEGTHVQTSPQVEAATEAAESALLSTVPPHGTTSVPTLSEAVAAPVSEALNYAVPAVSLDASEIAESTPQAPTPTATATATPDVIALPPVAPTEPANSPVGALPSPSAPPIVPPALVAQVTTYQDGMPTVHHQVPIRLYQR